MAKPYVRKDRFYQEAKDQGLRSRAYFKLAEIDRKHHIFKPHFRVLDLGAWPGGWLEYLAEKLPSGLAVGIDLVKIEELSAPNIKVLQGDIRDATIIESAKAFTDGHFEAVISDLSPKLTGIREVDQAASSGLAEAALSIAREVLVANGTFIAKVFKGNDTEVFVKTARPLFNKLCRVELDATRKSSNEFYVLALGYKGQQK